jgi:CarboxypepD_reg-like domain/MG2 domain
MSKPFFPKCSQANPTIYAYELIEKDYTLCGGSKSGSGKRWFCYKKRQNLFTMHPNLLLIIGLFVSGLALAQPLPTTTLTGRITETGTAKPVPFANVFINNTTRGTVADADGRYRLAGVPLGTVELVASFIGYNTARQQLRIENTEARVVNMTLNNTGLAVAEVTIKARTDRRWLRQLRQFKSALLGSSAFARQCVLENPNVLDFSEQDGHLIATAVDALSVENRALGYRIRYELQSFDAYREGVLSASQIRFEELKPTDDKENRRWQRNRLKAYYGSTKHFLVSLIRDSAEKEGFLIYRINPKYPRPASMLFTTDLNRHLLPVRADSVLKPGRLPFERVLSSPTLLRVWYNQLYSRESPYRDLPYAYSEIRLPIGYAEITTDGWLTQPNGFEAAGYLGNDRLATLLPADWQPPTQTAQAVTPLLLMPTTPDSTGSATPDTTALRPTVFVHTDKGIYATGDTLRMSLYRLRPAQAGFVPDDTYIQLSLLDSAGKIIRQQPVSTRQGRAALNWFLPDSLPPGQYRLRAERKSDSLSKQPDFERITSIVSPKKPMSPMSISSVIDQTISVRVLPEGGRWINDLPTRLGIWVYGPDGRGQAMGGTVKAAINAKRISFETNSVGIGSAEIIPSANEIGTLQIARADGDIQLPTVQSQGLTLAVDATSDSSQIRVAIGASANLRGEVAYLIVDWREQIKQRNKLIINNKQTLFAISTDSLPAGVCRFRLFDQRGVAQAERLVFVPDKTQPVAVEVRFGKKKYSTGDTVIISMNVADLIHGSETAFLSVAVTDARFRTDDPDEADIRAQLLLVSQLSQPVEQPNRFFADKSPKTRRDLDDLLLIQDSENPAPPSLFLKHRLPELTQMLLTDAHGTDVLAWVPLLQTDPTGHATLRFLLPDRAVVVRVSVQGITASGRLVSQTALYKIR